MGYHDVTSPKRGENRGLVVSSNLYVTGFRFVTCMYRASFIGVTWEPINQSSSAGASLGGPVLFRRGRFWIQSSSAGASQNMASPHLQGQDPWDEVGLHRVVCNVHVVIRRTQRRFRSDNGKAAMRKLGNLHKGAFVQPPRQDGCLQCARRCTTYTKALSFRQHEGCNA
jgi:hypothetical protein